MLPEIADALNRYSAEDCLRYAATMLCAVRDGSCKRRDLNDNITLEVIKAHAAILQSQWESAGRR